MLASKLLEAELHQVNASSFLIFADAAAKHNALCSIYDTDDVMKSFNYRLFNGKLQLAASPSVSFYRMTGLFDISKSPFYCNVSATYYLGDFCDIGQSRGYCAWFGCAILPP